MAATAVDKVFDELGKMTVLDLVELKKKIEDEWPSPPPLGRGRGRRRSRGRRRRRRRGEDRVRRRPHGRGRQEDPGDQGRPRDHGPRPQGGRGPRRRRSERRQGGRGAGGGRLDQGAARGGRRLRRGQVAPASPRARRAGPDPALRVSPASPGALGHGRGRGSSSVQAALRPLRPRPGAWHRAAVAAADGCGDVEEAR